MITAYEVSKNPGAVHWPAAAATPYTDRPAPTCCWVAPTTTA